MSVDRTLDASLSVVMMTCVAVWTPARRSFECPCHGGIYDTTGQPIAGPALYTTPVRRLPHFSWKVEEDIVYVLA